MGGLTFVAINTVKLTPRVFVKKNLKTPLETAAGLNTVGDGTTTVSPVRELVTQPDALVTITA